MSHTQQAEWEEVADRFGAALEQVRRDHLISHVLAALSSDVSTDDLVFFGGTALSRTFLADARLSEDIDLIALAPRPTVAAQVAAAVRRGLARSHGRPAWRPALTETSGSQPAELVVDGTASVQVQLLSGAGYLWPTEVREIEQRYSDAPPARLRTLTGAGFAAAKLGTWIDRHAPRDLYDLWALAERGLIDADAVEVFVRRGPFGRPPQAWVFDSAPAERAWRYALGHQTRLRVTAEHALVVVRAASQRAGSEWAG
ncbi:nucleotidyl transferase AbiEii/AbiGii toxin family protein [Cellulomonas sp. SLBN-39]|uniref:nucleotidyl transferase AbiEii/AbiGii toxin family protein n=1 Tax=Cellulomonas sp. SLBN-39 TaxID=2768446 RepID=UPI0011539035|nr:nucleotidyl transferase AbiEii/AbiGii toxin family protein [Cellulomonas sp. SLBN-39]TQL01096.1 nucleotidyltransferase AbiEii toxin of type IV toxin-antitoxin system [Cellulomonas sp. SLBN-39]